MPALTGIILCGGKGERLKPFTDHLPKPLIELNGKPVLYHLMNYLALGGVSRFVLCTGYKAECIEQFVRGCANPAWQVTCVNSGDASMTDRILDVLPHVPGAGLVCYGDTLANVDVGALKTEHKASGALATLTVYPLHSPFGIVSFDGSNRVTQLLEKPVLPHWINIGFLLCEPAAFRFLKPRSDLVEFSSVLAAAKLLNVYRHRGRHITINTEKERAQAELEMVEFATIMDYQSL
jgi:glucose-1-phosphate cytidylyltransferase